MSCFDEWPSTTATRFSAEIAQPAHEAVIVARDDDVDVVQIRFGEDQELLALGGRRQRQDHVELSLAQLVLDGGEVAQLRHLETARRRLLLDDLQIVRDDPGEAAVGCR